MADQKVFWMVAGNGPCSVRHAEMYLAEREAQRLARMNPGKEFYVMQAVVMHRKVDVERVDLWSDYCRHEEPF